MEFDDNLPEMMASLVKQRGGKRNDDYDGNPSLLWICQQFYYNVNTITSTPQAVGSFSNPTTTHTEMEEILMLEELLQVQASHCELKPAAQTVGFSARCLGTAATVYKNNNHEWMEHCKSTFQLQYAPICYISPTI